MGIPQLNSEGVDQTGGSTAFTIDFTGFTFAVNDILEISMVTDGWVPSITTANGWAIAQDPVGNSASVTTNGGTVGAGQVGMFVYWKRATGTTPTSDPPPVFAAPSAQSGTCWALEPNSYTGARTSGTPWHAIATSILTTAATAITSDAQTSTLANCLFMTRVGGGGIDDSSFPNWAMSGSSGPSGTQVASGWHAAAGNKASFTGTDGGYATAGGPHNGTCTFATSAKQARISLIMASLAESSAPDEESPGNAAPRPTVQRIVPVYADQDGLPSGAASSIPVSDDEATPYLSWRSANLFPFAAFVEDQIAAGAAPSFVEDDGQPPAIWIQFGAWAAARAPADDDLPVAAGGGGTVTSGIGGACDAQRSFNAAPQTGTLTTAAPVPTWAVLTAYVVDPTAGGINRVINGGNLYQCSVGGTSASTGGPTGTGTNITDGTVHWYYVGPAQGTDTLAGSQILATVMRGDQSLVGANIDPTDNDGGTFTVISNTSYGGNFPNSFAGVWRRSAASSLKTGYTASAQWGGSSGAGDELSLAWIELQGVKVGAPHAFSQVIRTSSTGGTVTAAAITTTKPCLIVAYWFGEGTVQSAGSPDAATPAGGLTLIAGSTAPLSLTANGYIQHMAAWRKAGPGTFSEVWTASPTDQGAQLVTIAFEDLSSISFTEGEEVAALCRPVPPAPWLGPALIARRSLDNGDEIPLAAIIDEDGPLTVVVWASAAARPLSADADDAPTAALTIVEEHPGAPQPAWAIRWSTVQVADDDSPVAGAAPSIGVDDDLAAVTAPWPSWSPPGRTIDDDSLASVVAAIGFDDDSGAAPRAWFSQPAQAPAADGDQQIPAMLDDEPGPARWTFTASWMAPVAIPADDELSIAPPPPPPPIFDDEPIYQAVIWSLGFSRPATGQLEDGTGRVPLIRLAPKVTAEAADLLTVTADI